MTELKTDTIRYTVGMNEHNHFAPSYVQGFRIVLVAGLHDNFKLFAEMDRCK